LSTEKIGIWEKMGQVIAKTDAAHTRLDKLEGVIREDLAKLNAAVASLLAEMHKTQGRNGAILFIVGGVGAILGAILSIAATIIFK
jgi:hypothetical protein